jgi:8-oxo-dGTP pyrophosphatase MutT (NUDIX family)
MNYRNYLYNKLENYNSSFIEENYYKLKMLDLLKNHPNPFERDCPSHFTASAFLLNSDRSKFLLMHHRKLDKWFQPGGHCDGNENILEVSIKEAREESGINEIRAISEKIYDIDIHLIPKIHNEEEHYHYDVRFLLQTIDNDSLFKNKESKDIRWVSFDCFDEFSINDNLKRMIKKYQNQILF